MGGSKHREETSIGTAMPLIDLTYSENALSNSGVHCLSQTAPSRSRFLSRRYASSNPARKMSTVTENRVDSSIKPFFDALDLDYARGRHTACARPFLIFPRGVSKGWSRLESCTPGEQTESQQVTARS